jgi:hypothetical protein
MEERGREMCLKIVNTQQYTRHQCVSGKYNTPVPVSVRL